MGIVELEAVLRPAGGLLGAIQGAVGGATALQREEGGELSIRVMRAPAMPGLAPGKWLAAVVEGWKGGHVEVIAALHADSAAEAFKAIEPLFTEIAAARKT